MISKKELNKISKSLFVSSFEDDSLDFAKVRKIFDLFVKKKPRGFLLILKNYLSLLIKEESKKNILVETDVQLSTLMTKKIKSELINKYGEGLNIEFKVNPLILGGMIIYKGDDILDGSLKSRLNQLQTAFLK